MEYVKLGDIAKIVAGSTAPKENQFNDNIGLPFIRAGHLEDLCNNYDLKKLPKIDENNKNIKKQVKVPKNTIVFAKSGMSCMKSRVYQTTEECYIVNHLAGVICSENVNPSYLKYYFMVNKPNRLIVDESYPSIRLSDISNMDIYLPNLDTQQKIAEVLDKAQELIDKRKEQIELLDELVKSIFIEMFGDPFIDENNFGMNKLGEVTIVNPKKAEVKELDDKLNVSFVPMEKVGEKGEFNSEISKTIKELYSGFTYFRDNDVLFAKITPCMENGKGAIATNLINGIGFGSTEFHVIRPIIKKSNPYWIYHLSTLIEFRRLAERKMTGSAGQKRVPTDFINNLKVVVPPIELQNQFADFVKQVDKIKLKMQNSLKELEDNFNSLMQKAFKGELF